VKKFLAGILCGAMLASCIAVFAETTQTIEAIFGRVKLVVDGKAVAEETLLYNDRTYVPLRAAAEMLGKQVSYDDETQTAYIGATPRPPGAFKAGFITMSMSNSSQKFSWDEFRRLAPDYGFEMRVFAGENEPQVEIAGIEQCIAEGYDAIFVNPSSIEAVVPALKKAKEAGLIVGMFSSELPPEYQHLYDFFVDSDDFLGAKQAGEFVSKQFPNGANFVEVGGQAGHDAQIKRRGGFREGIAANIIELDSQNCPGGWNAYEALVITEDFIVKHGDRIDIIFCHWDHGAGAVIEALRAAGMNHVYVIGVDGNSTGYQQVKDGRQWLSVGRSWTSMVVKSFDSATTLLEGGTVPEINIIPWDIVTIETIDNFPWPEW